VARAHAIAAVIEDATHQHGVARLFNVSQSTISRLARHPA
jgi:predicted XRE-type DNA-binding protein